jgi:AcrR family transcriptional regulator
MTKISKETIIDHTTKMFALGGYDSFSMRHLADSVGISPSVLYHYFEDKDVLRKEMFDNVNKNLGLKRSTLPKTKTASQMLKQRIGFQIDNQEEVVAVLKYYLAYRNNFKKFKNGYVPDKSALHIEEVLREGVSRNEFIIKNLEDDAKVITHAINGFLLEYYPHTPKGAERQQLINRIFNFLIRGLKGGDK